MKNEELLREFLNLSPKDRAQVVDLIESLGLRYRSKNSTSNASTVNLTEEKFVGMWRDRDEMEDSSAWVRGTREREWVR